MTPIGASISDPQLTTADEMGSYLMRFHERPEIRPSWGKPETEASNEHIRDVLETSELEASASVFVDQSGTAHLVYYKPSPHERPASSHSTSSSILVAWLDSSTSQTNRSGDVDEELADVFTIASQRNFDEDAETDFSQKLLAFIDYYHGDAIDALSNLIESGKADIDVVTDVLSLVGRSDDNASYPRRLRLLLTNLTSSSPRIRYGAVLGLASMGNHIAIPFVKQAIKQERDRILQKVLAQLKAQLDG